MVFTQMYKLNETVITELIPKSPSYIIAQLLNNNIIYATDIQYDVDNGEMGFQCTITMIGFLSQQCVLVAALFVSLWIVLKAHELKLSHF
jgi:hypothetical protein